MKAKAKTTRKNPPQTPPKASSDTASSGQSPNAELMLALAAFFRSGTKLLDTIEEQIRRGED